MVSVTFDLLVVLDNDTYFIVFVLVSEQIDIIEIMAMFHSSPLDNKIS